MDHLALIGILNSSNGVFLDEADVVARGSSVDSRGARQTTTPFEDFWEHDATKLCDLPSSSRVPGDAQRGKSPRHPRPTPRLPPPPRPPRPDPRHPRRRPRHCRLPPPPPDRSPGRAQTGRSTRSTASLEPGVDLTFASTASTDGAASTASAEGSNPADPLDSVPEVALGERAFEIVLARAMAAGEVETKWFERHSWKTPITEIPARWPAAYRDLVERRISTIATNPNLALIEKPEYKRRWAADSWDNMEKRALPLLAP